MYENIGRTCVHMPICKVNVNDTCTALVMLDSASTNSFMTKSLSEKLGLTGSQVEYNLNTLSGTYAEKFTTFWQNAVCVLAAQSQFCGVHFRLSLYHCFCYCFQARVSMRLFSTQNCDCG